MPDDQSVLLAAELSTTRPRSCRRPGVAASSDVGESSAVAWQGMRHDRVLRHATVQLAGPHLEGLRL